MKERFYDLLDEGIALAAKPLGKPVWNQMKDNAWLASADGGWAAFTAGEIASCLAGMPGMAELLLVGHLAGSIFISPLLAVLAATDPAVISLTPFPPAFPLHLFLSLPHLL